MYSCQPTPSRRLSQLAILPSLPSLRPLRPRGPRIADDRFRSSRESSTIGQVSSATYANSKCGPGGTSIFTRLLPAGSFLLNLSCAEYPTKEGRLWDLKL